jgi:hypothetical protein
MTSYMETLTVIFIVNESTDYCHIDDVVIARGRIELNARSLTRVQKEDNVNIDCEPHGTIITIITQT